MSKLVELLPQQSSKLLQTFKNDSDVLEWVNRPDPVGAQLTKLWRTVMNDEQQAEVVFQQVLLSNTQGWEVLLLQGGMQELLDLTRYLAVDQQETSYG